jgi:pimeloyl-ACP methyl ester carboxylesterase
MTTRATRLVVLLLGSVVMVRHVVAQGKPPVVPFKIQVSEAKEINIPPRRWVEQQYNLTRWTEMPRGGHFAAMEEPELLVDDVRAFFRSLR